MRKTAFIILIISFLDIIPTFSQRDTLEDCIQRVDRISKQNTIITKKYDSLTIEHRKLKNELITTKRNAQLMNKELKHYKYKYLNTLDSLRKLTNETNKLKLQVNQLKKDNSLKDKELQYKDSIISEKNVVIGKYKDSLKNFKDMMWLTTINKSLELNAYFKHQHLGFNYITLGKGNNVKKRLVSLIAAVYDTISIGRDNYIPTVKYTIYYEGLPLQEGGEGYLSFDRAYYKDSKFIYPILSKDKLKPGHYEIRFYYIRNNIPEKIKVVEFDICFCIQHCKRSDY